VPDTFSSTKRSEIMSRVRSKNTQPELSVRTVVHGLGYRYRLHSKSLAGSPDIVLARHRKIIFVHGCFWHGHSCSAATLPKSNRGYWELKQHRNADRDRENIRTLRRLGWKVLIIWECEIKSGESLRRRLKRFLAAG
jgi:DNA mismatch endonuclease (patch repair protein)